jgi:hypothetical protein
MLAVSENLKSGKYLIQGDFLLVANRESVDSSKWNDSILEGVFRTFAWRAVPRFNEIHGSFPSLRYTWPLFLKDRGGTNEFWSKLKRWVFIRLATEDVLECRHSMDLSRPDSLFYIPSEFRFEGEPLVEDEKTEPHHLSFAYDPEINQILPELKKNGREGHVILRFLYRTACSHCSTRHFISERKVQPMAFKSGRSFSSQREGVTAKSYPPHPFT